MSVDLTAAQRRNAITVIRRVRIRGHKRRWSPARTARIARLCIECCLTESNLLNYGSHKVPNSMALPHDAVGSDHHSVGVFQQQVPQWGPVSRCQDVDKATIHFLDALAGRGLDRFRGPRLWHRIQSVQVSFDATGENYHRNHDRALLIRRELWRAAKP